MINTQRQTTTNYGDIDANEIDSVSLDSVQDQEETRYNNDRFQLDWNAFNSIPKLRSAIIMKAIWTCGKGYECDEATKIKLEQVRGNGKQTFKDILFNLVVMKQVCRDSFAEIIRDEEGNLLNIKVLDPSTITIVFGRNGMIKRYEQTQVMSDSQKGIKKYEPDKILHLSHNNFGGEMHGRSVPESVWNIILADDENFKIMKKTARFQAVPFIVFKVKSDNAETIAKFKSSIKDARENSEDLIIPDDENILSWEVVQVNPSAFLAEWRNSLNNQFYQAVGMPLILFGSAGSTESGGKIEYLGHETIFEHDQKEIEEQIDSQLGLKINLISPTSLLESLRTDENKDAQNAIAMQQSDMMAGAGR